MQQKALDKVEVELERVSNRLDGIDRRLNALQVEHRTESIVGREVHVMMMNHIACPIGYKSFNELQACLRMSRSFIESAIDGGRV